LALYISRIKVKNFRNFKRLDLSLCPSAVIVGENKVGKSNLVHAVRLVLDPSLPDTYRILKAEDFWDGISKPFSGKEIRIVLEMTGFEEDKAAQAVLTDCLVKKNPYVARLTYIFRPRAKLDSDPSSENDYEYLVFGGNDEKNRVASDVRHWISVFLLPALRDAESDLDNWRRSPLRPLLERLNIDSGRLKTILKDLNEVNSKLAAEQPVASLANEITSRIDAMVGTAFGIDTRLGLTPSEGPQLLRSLKLFVDGDKSRPISQASLGSANVLFLALLLQKLDASRSDRSLVSTILAIEEPEAHLHPQVQRLLFRYFLGQQYPVLVTTHSPYIASVAPIDSLVLLKQTKKLGSIGYSTSRLPLSGAERDDLQRYIDVTRAEVLFAKGVILVEGAAEQFLIPAFAKFLPDSRGEPVDLDRFGISVCSVNGTEFGVYRKLLGSQGMAVPHVVVTDGDPSQSDGRTVHNGLLRSIKLVEDDNARRDATRDYARRRWNSTRQILADQDVFVNEDTLELELIESFKLELVRTYRELTGSREKATNFAALLEEPSENRTKILSRIERIGKGRFAQRLAPKIEGKKPPAYIKNALDKIIKLATR
jgi:putative ATP-dependent endonuclease of OLD family